MRYAQECRTQIFIAIPATATGGLKIKAVAEESGVSTHRAAIGNDSAVANQIALASDVSAINANRQIMQQPVIHAGQETAICNLITVRVLVLVMYRHIIAATHGESAPAIVRRRRRRRRRNVLAFLNRWIVFHYRSAIRVSIIANLVHPSLQVFALHNGPRETDLVHRGELFWRNQIKNSRQIGRWNATENP